MHIKALIPALLLASASATAWAHHGWSSYDANKKVTVQAAPTDVQYRNPHAEIDIVHEGETWDVILAPIGRMESRGLSKDDLTVGKTITIEGYPRNDGKHEIRAERIIVDGKTIELR